MEKVKCPTCNRTIAKNPQRYSIIEFHRKVRKITDIDSLNAIKDYILRVIKYYYSQDIFNMFDKEFTSLKEQDNAHIDIQKIKNWILSYFIKSSDLSNRDLTQIHNTSLFKKICDYLVIKYKDKDIDLDTTFSQFYEDFNNFNEVEQHNARFSKQAVSRTLRALGIISAPKKINNKTKICLYVSKEELISALHDLL
jgi:hypothetical protein